MVPLSFWMEVKQGLSFRLIMYNILNHKTVEKIAFLSWTKALWTFCVEPQEGWVLYSSIDIMVCSQSSSSFQYHLTLETGTSVPVSNFSTDSLRWALCNVYTTNHNILPQMAEQRPSFGGFCKLHGTREFHRNRWWPYCAQYPMDLLRSTHVTSSSTPYFNLTLRDHMLALVQLTCVFYIQN